MAVVSARGDGDRCDAGESCEVGVALEALGTGCLADQDRSGQVATAGLLKQLWTLLADQVAQLALQ